ncbi:MAG TPA: DegV family protein, partial [Sphaerochaeta sp.]|nr:DegV family protein [Sphaerochaeta sp.]
GRIPKRLGSMILKMNFKPMIGLTKEGGGKILGVRFSRTGSISALVKQFMRVHKKEGIESYGMSYIGNSELAFSVARIVEEKTGLKPLFVEQASPVIALHAGKGSLSLSYVRKASLPTTNSE